MILRCPQCKSRTIQTTRLYRWCRVCGYHGEPQEFVFEPPPEVPEYEKQILRLARKNILKGESPHRSGGK